MNIFKFYSLRYKKNKIIIHKLYTIKHIDANTHIPILS